METWVYYVGQSFHFFSFFISYMVSKWSFIAFVKFTQSFNTFIQSTLLGASALSGVQIDQNRCPFGDYSPLWEESPQSI